MQDSDHWPSLQVRSASDLDHPATAAPGRVSAAWQTRGVTVLYGLVLVAYLAWQLQPTNLGAFSYDYDEGVYLQSAWAVQRGYTLFSDVFSSQPPLIPVLLAGVFNLTGPSVIAARVTMVLLALAGLIGSALLAHYAGGWRASLGALALLSLVPPYMEGARTVSPEVPALALAMLAVGLAAVGVRRGPRWWLAAGIALALGTLAKLSALIAVPALACLLLARLRSTRHLGRFLSEAALLAAPGLLLWGVVAARVDVVAAYDQLFVFRQAARDTSGYSLRANIDHVHNAADSYYAIWLLALAGSTALALRRRWSALLTCGGVLGAAFAALLTHAPLFSHHVVMLAPAAAVLGSVGLAEAIAATGAVARRPRVLAQKPALLLPILVLIGALWLAPVMIVVQWGQLATARESWDGPDQAVAALKALPPEYDLVVTDEQMIAFAAGRPVPPWLVDTSRVRLGTGYLTLEPILAAIPAERSTVFLFWSDRLRRVSGLYTWVKEEYVHEQEFGPRKDLFIRS